MPVHNALPSVRAILTNLDEVTSPTTLIIVDDASDADTRKVLQDFPKFRPVISNTTLLRNERQQLFTRTVNRGIREAVHRYNAKAVTVVNTDCILKDGWLLQLQQALKDPRVGMAGFWDNNYPDVDLKKQPYTEMKAPGYVTGHCFTLRVEMLREIGILCETDTTGKVDPALAAYKGQAHIGSERLLCNKANLRGWKTVYVNAPLVEHGDGKSWGRDLRWLNQFVLEPLWHPCDTLDEPTWIGV